MPVTAARYTPDSAAQWNEMVEASRNGTFLFNRAYMDYHADRFDDHSLMFSNDSGRLIAILPASLDSNGSRLVSHGGLTYGGLVYGVKGITAPAILEIFDALKAHCRAQGITEIVYKAIPHIYHRVPAEEDIYALFRNDAVLTRVDLSSAIDMGHPVGMDSSYRRYVRLADRQGIVITESHDFARFWEILTFRLKTRHNAAPVHSLAEFELLQSRFPANIRLFAAMRGGEMLAGSVMFFTDTCAHSQYIGSTEAGRELKAIPAIFNHILTSEMGTRRWLDFGTSNEDAGRYLNEGLIDQKRSMGALGIAYPTYTISL